MRLAIQDSWPNLPDNAEREWIKRFQIACENVGVETCVVVTSDDIVEVDPTAVLVTHEFSRKLTATPTIGLIWSPLRFFRDDPYRMQSLRSYDGYLAGNDTIKTFLKDIQFGFSSRKPIGKELFLPTSYSTDHLSVADVEEPSLFYAGVHWDGSRHRDLFAELARRDMITCYGPPKSWGSVGSAYGGALPTDGRAVIETIAKHGLALCLHKAEHRAENTPSMRIFEALSVGAVPICDDIKFARENLSDFAHFVDMEQNGVDLAEQIEQIVLDTRRNPDVAIARAEAAKRWFDTNWSLEARIKSSVIPLVEEVLDVGRFRASPSRRGVTLANAGPRTPDCEVVVRTGGRTVECLARTIDSIRAADSEEFRLGVVLVDYKGRADLEAFATAENGPDFAVRYVRSRGTGFRSTALWDGVRAVEAPFVAHMDDDDTVFPNHYRQLASCFDANPHANVCYTGVITHEDEDGFYYAAPNFDGPGNKEIAERRHLTFLDVFDLSRLARFDNFIQSNTWMTRREFIHRVMGDDPELVVTEDVYLYLLMAADGPFAFTGSPTALWHWRSTTKDNSMKAVDQAIWADCVVRGKTRLNNVPFKASITFADILNPPSRVGESKDDPKEDNRPPESLPPVNFNQAIEGGLEFKEKTILRGFHEPEVGGIWSKQHSATVVFTIGNQIREQGGILVIECIGSMADLPDRWLELGLDGSEHRRLEIKDWSLNTVELPLAPNTPSPLTLKLTTSHLIGPEGGGPEKRALGGFIQSFRVVARSAGKIASTPPRRPGAISGGVGLAASQCLALAPEEPASLIMQRGAQLARIDAPNGRFVVPPSMAGPSTRYVLLPHDPTSRAHVEVSSDGSDPTPIVHREWAAPAAKFVGHRSGPGADQVMVVFDEPGTGSVANYLLLMAVPDAIEWRVRPFYGLAWRSLSQLGSAGLDSLGPYRDGAVASVAALPLMSTEPGASGGEVTLAAVLIAAAVHALTSDGAGPMDKLAARLLREVMMEAGLGRTAAEDGADAPQRVEVEV